MQDGEQMCRYRIVQDGLPLLLPYVTRQMLQPTVQEFLNLIEGRSLYVPEEARAVPPASAAGEAAGGEAAAAAADGAGVNGAAADGAGVNGAVADAGKAQSDMNGADAVVKAEAQPEGNQAEVAGQATTAVHCCIYVFFKLCATKTVLFSKFHNRGKLHKLLHCILTS